MNNQVEITVVSLGPDAPGLLTLAAAEAMRGAPALVLRTARHAAAEWLRAEGIAFETLDALYEQSEDFDELCTLASRELIARAEAAGTLCYAVSDPASDATVRALAGSLPQGMRLRVTGGVSLAQSAACAALSFGINTENLRTVTALSTQELRVQADCPLAVTEIDNRCLASDVKLWLTDLYDDETRVVFLENAAEPFSSAREIGLCELDRQAHYDHRTAVVVPAVSVYERSRASYEDFVQVIARLRAPGGCPWDRAQTHHTLRQYMIEEACEAAEVMDRDDPLHLADELGDVLLQVVLNSQIGAEHRDFTDRDVTSMAAQKMISRHAHVFGREKAESAQDVVPVWEQAKRRERGEQTPLERALDVPGSLPALMRAQKVAKRLADGDIDEGSALAAAQQALARLAEGRKDEAAVGMLLEACAALAQALGVDAETALRSQTARRLDALRTQAENHCSD